MANTGRTSMLSVCNSVIYIRFLSLLSTKGLEFCFKALPFFCFYLQPWYNANLGTPNTFPWLLKSWDGYIKMFLWVFNVQTSVWNWLGTQFGNVTSANLNCRGTVAQVYVILFPSLNKDTVVKSKFQLKKTWVQHVKIDVLGPYISIKGMYWGSFWS